MHRVTLTGVLPPGVTGKDVIVARAGQHRHPGAAHPAYGRRLRIKNALIGVEVPRLVQRLRETFAAKDGEDKLATRHTGWKLVWDVRRSRVEVTEGEGGATWSQKVGELPPNVQEIIARGGREK